MLSFHNVVARYAFAMGREGLLPAPVRAHPAQRRARHRAPCSRPWSPWWSSAAFAVADDKPAGDPTAPVLHLLTWRGSVGALGVIALMALASVAVIAFFARRGAARAQAPRLVTPRSPRSPSWSSSVYTVKDFDVLVRTGPGSALSWALPAIIALAALAGVV